MRVKIVTAIYQVGWKDITFFCENVRIVAGINPNIGFVVYTNNKDRLKKYFASIENIKVVTREVEDFHCYDSVKQSFNLLNDYQKSVRFGNLKYLCLMHEKANFVSENESLYVYWMDAHLLSHILLPEMYMGRGFDLTKLAVQKMKIFKIPHAGNLHGVDMSKFGTELYDGKYMIGGFWGGACQIVGEFLNDYGPKAEMMLQNNCFGTDENVFTLISNDFDRSLIKEYNFEQWYHQDTRLWKHDISSPMDPNLVSFSDVFAKNFLEEFRYWEKEHV